MMKLLMQRKGTHAVLSAKTATTPPPGSGGKSGWFSPNYTVSQPATLDMHVLESNRIVAMHSDRPETEQYKLLRTQVLHRMQANGWNTLMITSPEAGDGKTTTAINLAITFAREYSHTAILVDCDLRQQAIHQRMGFAGRLGLADYLLDDHPMHDIIIWPGIEKLTVISGKRTIQDSTELLSSQRMQVLVQEMKTRYPDRFVFFDVPPLLTVADAVAFAPFVDAVLIVVREGHTRMPGVQRALTLVPKERFLGYVMNAKV
jgi:protein-tyrosine kinase